MFHPGYVVVGDIYFSSNISVFRLEKDIVLASS